MDYFTAQEKQKRGPPPRNDERPQKLFSIILFSYKRCNTAWGQMLAASGYAYRL
jgi:hypothetical protein